MSWDPTGPKRTRPDRNIANAIGDYLRSAWPELSSFSDVWVTGSHVWRFLYGEEPRAGADLDLIVCDQGMVSAVLDAISPLLIEPPADAKPTTSMGGRKFYTSRGNVDVWINADVFDALRGYTARTHGHCRAAYQPKYRQLVVIDNSGPVADDI